MSRNLVLNNKNLSATDPDHQYVILPFTDFLNHDFNPNVILQVEDMDKRYQADGIVEKEKAVFCYALRDISIGEQLFVSYGECSNMNLMSNYGFTVKDNPNNKLSITFGIQN